MVATLPLNHDETFDVDALTAQDRVDSVKLQTQVADIKNAVNSLIGDVSEFTRDDNTIADEHIRLRMLHPEVVVNLSGLMFVEAVDVMSVSNIGLSGLSVIDGYTPIANDRVLLTAQTDPIQNGIWVAAAGAWTRAADFTGAKTVSDAVSVINGTVYAQSTWRLSADAVIGTGSNSWILISGLTTVTPIARGGTAATTASQALTNLGLTAFGKSLVDDADAAAGRTTLGMSALGQALATAATAAEDRLSLGGVTISVDTVAAMTALAGNDRVGTILVRGYFAKGDRGGDVFYWDAASTETADGVRAFSSDAGGVGRFVRVSKNELTLAQCGCVGDNVADDITQFNAGILYTFDLGGGTLLGIPGKTYKLSNGPLVKPGVKIDLQWCVVNLVFPNLSDYVGFDMRNNTSLKNGTINVAELGPPTSSDKSLHCAVLVGNSGGILEGFSGINLSDLTITTNRDGFLGGRGILVQADSNDITIKNIFFPDSAYLGSAVELHFASNGIGTLTKHPYNITVENIYLGTITKTGASFDIAAIDIVGCYNVTVRNVECKAWAGDAFVQVRVGGFGTTIAGATIAPLLFKNTIVENVSCRACTKAMVIVNAQASIAAGNPIYEIPAIFNNITGVGIGASATTAGLRVLKSIGAVFNNCNMSKFVNGILIDEASRLLVFNGGIITGNRQSGVYVVHGTSPTDILFRGTDSYLNGQAGSGYAGFEVDNTVRVTFENCFAGHVTSETTQSYGFKVTSSAVGTRFLGRNKVRNIKAAGTKYLFTGPVYGQFTLNGGTNAAMATGANEYATISGVGKSAAEVDSTVLSGGEAILLTNFQVKLSTAPTAGKSYAIRILDDGAATALEVNIVDANTTGSDYDAVEVAAGSELSVQTLPSGTPAASRAKWSTEVLFI